MDDDREVARLLDILGNRNRRRIIELLRQKPCFVTEISDTLLLSPKAVIDHLQLMERESILSCETDDRRRKYYYLENDILIDVSLRQARVPSAMTGTKGEQNEQLKNSVIMLARMIKAHDQILSSLEQVNHDIELKISDIAHNHKDIFLSERDFTVIIALSHDSLTLPELEEATKVPQNELVTHLRRFERVGIVKRVKEQYSLRGVHAE
ncbi:MAG: ArsR family transcriptional regulator [Methanomicrobiales archaeon HGW-Methanomicrobiales-1]|jgi:ArsR family transcriptional regulator|nr:MAG: ArsR family transcriptional regulator [Methanomicrobiales archaeon HGW-Methanomicrobiales-1]